jgi:superfamily II DNA or RNA helicase
VQRRRADVKDWLGDTTPFPERESLEYAYALSPEYRLLFDSVFEFARGLVQGITPDLSYAKQRGRYWSALAIVLCVMSSPAAAVATLTRSALKQKTESEEELVDELSAPFVYDGAEGEGIVDSTPTAIVDRGQSSYKDSQRKQLREFVRIAEILTGSKDRKLQSAIALVKHLLAQGYNPIVWCRYIATANYVAKGLTNELDTKKSPTRIIAITGEQSEDEREIRIQELKSHERRVMVATDCLSEGVNLQEHFTAVIHYDLPWNPNRLEQREGRVDRYGQRAEKVKCILTSVRVKEISL